MCRQTSTLNKVAFTVLILGCLAAALAFSAPFWVRIPDPYGLNVWNMVTYQGLWALCCPDNQQTASFSCIWIWDGYSAIEKLLPPCNWVEDSNYKDTSSLPPWYTTAQIIYCVALGFLFVAILLQSINICCRCCKNPTCFPTVVASIATSGAILVGLSLGIYGGFSYKDGMFAPVLVDGKGGQLEWAYYVGIAGAGTVFISGILFFIDGCIETKHYRGYKSPVLGTQ